MMFDTSKYRKLIKYWSDLFFNPVNQVKITSPIEKRRILVLGVYLSDQLNTSNHIVSELKKSSYHQIDQRWARLGSRKGSTLVESATVYRSNQLVPKFQILNILLGTVKISEFDLLIVFDDDIVLPNSFIDSFVYAQEKCDFSLCQPARTSNSWIDHELVRQQPKLLARQTRFVEIGPVFSIKSDLFAVLLPFNELSPMGYGLDFAWPIQVERAQKRMGIIDAVPVHHSIRKPRENYDYDNALNEQNNLVGLYPCLEKNDAFKVLSYIKLT